MTVELWLESFDGGKSTPAKPSPEYERGFVEGHAIGQAEAFEDAARLNDQLVQAITDLSFTYAEARSQVLQSLQPLFRVVTEKVLPHCIENGFAGQLAGQLSQMTAADIGALSLHVHPDRVASVSAALGGSAGAVQVAPDPDLTPYAAWFGHDGHESLIDVDDLLTEISETLAALNSHQKDDEHHG